MKTMQQSVKSASVAAIANSDDAPGSNAVATLGTPGIAAMSASEILTGYAFTKASVSEYIANIRQLTARAFVAQRESVAAMVLLGRYCKDVGHDLKENDPGKFGAWLKENVPGVPYSAIATAMRIAVDLGKTHPELKRIDTPEKLEQLTLLIDGQSATAFGRALRGRESEGNIEPVSGKRLHFPTKPKPAADKHEDAEEKGRQNFRDSFNAIVAEVEQGNAALLCDEELGTYIGLLADLSTKLRVEILDPRTSGKKSDKKRSVRDLA